VIVFCCVVVGGGCVLLLFWLFWRLVFGFGLVFWLLLEVGCGLFYHFFA
jgi:hypothetical protein